MIKQVCESVSVHHNYRFNTHCFHANRRNCHFPVFFFFKSTNKSNLSLILQTNSSGVYKKIKSVAVVLIKYSLKHNGTRCTVTIPIRFASLLKGGVLWCLTVRGPVEVTHQSDVVGGVRHAGQSLVGGHFLVAWQRNHLLHLHTRETVCPSRSTQRAQTQAHQQEQVLVSVALNGAEPGPLPSFCLAG